MKRLFLLTLWSCLSPTLSHVELVAPEESPKVIEHRQSITEYCLDQYDHAYRDDCSAPLYTALKQGVQANDYQFEMQCIALRYASDLWWRPWENDDRTSALMQWGSLCQSEKGLAYKEKAQDAKSNAISVLTCADTDSLSSAFDTGYYCASHSYGYWRSEEVFETTIMDICVGLLAPTNKYAECQLTAKRLYRQMVEEKGGHQSL